MSMLFIGGALPTISVSLAIDGGIARNIEQLEDVSRSIGGSLLLTQLSGTASAYKEAIPCQTVAITEAAAEELVDKLRSAATLEVVIADPISAATPLRSGASDILTVHAIVKSITPVTLPAGRRWVVSFDLIEV